MKRFNGNYPHPYPPPSGGGGDFYIPLSALDGGRLELALVQTGMEVNFTSAHPNGNATPAHEHVAHYALSCYNRPKSAGVTQHAPLTFVRDAREHAYECRFMTLR